MGTVSKEKNYGIELLRVISAYAVIILHVSAEHLYEVPYGTYTSIVLNFGHGISRFAVTVFFMISGTLYLSEDYKLDINMLYFKRIIKYIVQYFAFALFYSLCYFVFSHSLSKNLFSDLISVLIHALDSPKYHLWFLPAYIGVLLSFPLIKAMLKGASNEKKMLQYILLFFGIDMIFRTLHVFNFECIDRLNSIVDMFHIDLAIRWGGVAILGHYLNKYFTRGIKKFCIFGVVLFGVAMFMSYVYFGRIETGFYDNLTLQTTWLASGIFIVFIRNASKWNIVKKNKGMIQKVSGLTMGVYLIHPFILNILNVFGINSLMCNSIIAVPIVALLAFCLSALITIVVRKIPKIGYWLV